MNSIRTPRWIRDALERIETGEEADRLLEPYERISEVLGRGRRGQVLRGEWLGHALHPLMTDVPLGCWMSATALDLVGGGGARPASRRLIGIGIVAALPTVASGFADYGTITTPRSRRVAIVHGVGNSLVLIAYARSWKLRGRDRQLRAVGWALFGGSLAIVTGYLGGHLSFARAVGTGERQLGLDAPASDQPVSSAEDVEHPQGPDR